MTDTAQNTYHYPGFSDETLALVADPGTAVFANPDHERLLYQDISQIPQDVLASRLPAYTAALRVMAHSRRQSRLARRLTDGGMPYNPLEWNERWYKQWTTRQGLGTIATAELYQGAVADIAAELEAAKTDPDWRPRWLNHDFEHEEGDVLSWSDASPRPASRSECDVRPHSGYTAGRAVFRRRGVRATSERIELLPHQTPYMVDLADFLDSCWEEQTSEVVETSVFSQGAVVVAPTGSGKTTLMARAIEHAGVGGPQDRRALFIVPSREIGDQLMGETGDDTLGRFAPDVLRSGYYGGAHDAEGQVVITTIESFVQNFRDGALDGNTFDLAIIDEAHHFLEPQFLETFKQHWRGPALLFTATPSYSERRDITQLFPKLIRHANILQLIEDGVLNGAQLFMFRIDPRDYPHMLPRDIDMRDKKTRKEIGTKFLMRAVADFVLSMARDGLRGIVFCESGGESAIARGLAEQLNELAAQADDPISMAGGRPFRAEAIGTFRSKNHPRRANQRIIREYDDGKVDALATVKAGGEGYNAADIDYVAIACSTGSLLELQQRIGRGARRSERGVSIYAQFFLPNSFREFRGQHDIYEAFGLEQTVVQGRTILPYIRPEGKVGIQPGRLSNELQLALSAIDGRPISAIGLGEDAAIEIPEGYMALDALIAGTNLDKQRARSILSRALVPWVGRVERTGREGNPGVARYYNPSARAIIEAAAKLERAGDNDVTGYVIATMAGNKMWQLKLEDMLAARPDLDQGTTKIGRNDHATLFWNAESAPAIAAALREWVDKGQRTIPAHVLPLAAVAPIFGMRNQDVLARITRAGSTAQKFALAGKGGPENCISWSDFQLQLASYAAVVSLPAIDFSKLPHDEHDTDDERAAHARAVQILLCNEAKLGLTSIELAAAKDLAATLFPEHYPKR